MTRFIMPPSFIEVIDDLLRLGIQEQNIILTFEKRLSSSYRHKKYVLQLNDAISRSVPPAERNKIIHAIRTEILPLFTNVLDYVQQEEDVIKKETVALSVEKSILDSTIVEAQKAYASKKLGFETAKKVETLLKRALSLKQLQEQTPQERVRSLIDTLRTTIIQEQTHITVEQNALDQLEKNTNKIESSSLVETLIGAVSALQKLMYQEKSLIDSLNPLLAEKISASSKIKKLFSEKDKVTLADIKADLRKLTKPEDVLEYIALLHQFGNLLDDPCRATLSRYGTRAVYQAKTSAFERAWETITDQLTQIFNRRYFDREIYRAVESAQETGTAVSLLIFDFDKFKPINELYGHKIGDRALKSIVDIISSRKKRTDVLFRYGGEEFALIASVAKAEAAKIADRLRIQVQTLSPRIVSELNITDREIFTVSVGVATFIGKKTVSSPQELTHSVNKLIDFADAGVRLAKESGRNRVEVASEDVTIQ